MITRFRHLQQSDAGVGLVMALIVSFIVFSLGAVWVATSTHELDQVTHNRHRTEAFNAAEAGARRAMAELQNNNDADGWFESDGTALLATEGVRTQAKGHGLLWLGYDPSAGGELCPAESLMSGADQLGEYVVRVERLDAADVGLEYSIESWGWGPNRDSRQSVLRKVQMDVVLRPLDSFAKALFASKSMVGTNRKEIYGDVYAGESVTISNFTRIYPNDEGETGFGQLEVFGDLDIDNGSNVEFGGLIRVQGALDDDSSGTSYTGADLVNAAPASGASGTFSTVNDFKNATTTDTIRYGGTLAGGWDVTPIASVISTNSLIDVPEIPLPTFEYLPADYPSMTKTNWGTNVSGFQAFFSSNKANLSGIHVVNLSGGSISVDFKNTRFSGHFFLVAQDGDLNVHGFTKGLSGTPDAPITVGLVLDDTRVPGLLATPVTVDDIPDVDRYTLSMSNGFNSIPGVVHHLIFSEGFFDVQNQATFYGTVYGNDDISSNRLEIHFRQPADVIASGFKFPIPDSTRFIAQPMLWRELSISEGTGLPATCS